MSVFFLSSCRGSNADVEGEMSKVLVLFHKLNESRIIVVYPLRGDIVCPGGSDNNKEGKEEKKAYRVSRAG